VVVVTGAGHGAGRTYAEALGGTGASVVVNDADPDAAYEVAERIAGLGGVAVAVPGSVGPTDVAERLVARAVADYGRLDVLVTNGGVTRDRMLWRMSDDEFDNVVEVHVRGTLTCARAAARQMRHQRSGGRIVALGSVAGQRGTVGQTGITAATAAIVGMVRTWSMECAPAGITVNAVIPGSAAPEVAAELVVFLASKESGGITGQAIGIDGDKLCLWSHPEEVIAAFCSEGWTAAAIAQAWPAVAVRSQSVGIPPVGVPTP
jgi:NAD(P)-dependent dehydrogenase (short-subunit alcohol dehydrogenase family)